MMIKLLAFALGIYLSIGFTFWLFVLAWASYYDLKLPKEEYKLALVGALLFWPILVKDWFHREL